MPVVISDTTALNYLARIGQFELLRLQFQHILIPPAVLAELKQRPDLPGERCVQMGISQTWLELRSPKKRNVVEQFRATLGAGESEAIALAQETPSSLLLMDEALDRAVAESETKFDRHNGRSFAGATGRHHPQTQTCPR